MISWKDSGFISTDEENENRRKTSYSLKINELNQISQAGVIFFKLNSC